QLPSQEGISLSFPPVSAHFSLPTVPSSLCSAHQSFSQPCAGSYPLMFSVLSYPFRNSSLQCMGNYTPRYLFRMHCTHSKQQTLPLLLLSAGLSFLLLPSFHHGHGVWRARTHGLRS